MRTLVVSGAILIGASLIAMAQAGRFSEDIGTRLRRECESILQQVPPSWHGTEPERFIKSCIMTRAGLR